MHNGCRQYLQEQEDEEVTDNDKKLEIFNQLRDTMTNMYRKAKREVQETIMVGKKNKHTEKPKLNNISPTPSQMNMSVMSKVKSVIEDKSEIGIEEIDSEILADYHQFFVERKQTILDQWEKDQSELK